MRIVAVEVAEENKGTMNPKSQKSGRLPLSRLTGSILAVACLATAIYFAMTFSPTTTRPAAAATSVATIASTPSQEIKGWGSYPSYHHHDWGKDSNIIQRNDVQNALYLELGITLIRCELRAVYGDGNGVLNSERLNDLVQHIKVAQAKNPNIKYMLSIWSPPAGMKTPAVTNGRDSEKKPTRLRTDKEDTFVSYVANVVIYLRNNGVGLPVAIGVQNEPRSAVKWDGCVYEAGQFQRVTKLMRAALNKAGLQNVQLLVAEGAVYEDNEALLGKGFSALKSDKELSAAVGAIATHSYDQWDKNDSDDYRHLLSVTKGKTCG
jgi:O-glycosyl hydrolase